MLFDQNELNSRINQIATSNILKIENSQANKVGYQITEKCDLSNYLSIDEILEKDIELISQGAFSMHQLVKFIIGLLGEKCNIYASTWATCETVVSGLINMKQKGLINDCFFLFDHRVVRYRPNAYALFNQNFQSKILSIHAKICVIESQNAIMRIVGSGNWTRNDKIEVYSISSNSNTCFFYKNFILNEFKLQQ